ncbi:unnamed protein product [Bursaphelenchus xylophilus]|uniref:(pine wood nematode) hypothetical protein n=1 Tax=Bursaphelenchus xylophilus TaxID=6326 RepID=A0A1I7S7L4_BURXY|nr:unnamed protein product [Bursaphelenchus xylophilus]CAG9111966.1 unnamed protein product [Bursaphelenchus xylophilus]
MRNYVQIVMVVRMLVAMAVNPEPIVTILGEVVYNTTERNDPPVQIEESQVRLRCNPGVVTVIIEDVIPFTGQIYATPVDSEIRLNTIKVRKGNYSSIQIPVCSMKPHPSLSQCQLEFNQLAFNVFVITNNFHVKNLIAWTDSAFQGCCDYRRHSAARKFNGRVEKLFPIKKQTDIVQFNSHYSITLEIGDIRRAPGTLANSVEFTFTRIDKQEDFRIKLCRMGIPKLNRWQDIIVEGCPVPKFYPLLYQKNIKTIEAHQKQFTMQLFSLAYDDFSPQKMELRCSFEECPEGGCKQEVCSFKQRLKRPKKEFTQNLKPNKLIARPVRLRRLRHFC